MNSLDVSATSLTSEAFDGRLAWRSSRWMIVLLSLLAILACGSLWLSDLPRTACISGDAVAAAYATWLLYGEARRKPCALAWPGNEAPWNVECEGHAETLLHVGANFRGGLTVLTLADQASGRKRRFVWWPDTLDSKSRRALRLKALASGNEAAGTDE
jgi:toxin CptA